MTSVNALPAATLETGVTVVNFSSSHPFTFDDGTVLGPCTKERADSIILEDNENSMPGIGPWEDVTLNFEMSPAVLEDLKFCFKKYSAQKNQLVLVGLPVLVCIRENSFEFFGVPISDTPFRGIRKINRSSMICSSRKFCV